ncbi:MAG: DUF2934 domain-containing protein [Pseudomonadota bacterium]|nr:DUF2934 domain-containing protein [Pseudomonadota bacterium]
MAAKKKVPFTARPKANKDALAASTLPVSTLPVSDLSASTPSVSELSVSSAVAAAPVAEITPVAAMPVVAAPVSVAPVSLPGLEVDERPMIHMPVLPTEQVVQATPVPHELVARRAHEIHLSRGGTAFDNWLQAEQELGAR